MGNPDLTELETITLRNRSAKVPNKTPRAKAEKAEAVHEVMSEYKDGTLRSGSKTGPKVKSRDQALAIAMSESGQSKAPAKSTPPPPPSSAASSRGSCGYGHDVTRRQGHLRTSGHSGAHRLGKK